MGILLFWKQIWILLKKVAKESTSLFFIFWVKVGQKGGQRSWMTPKLTLRTIFWWKFQNSKNTILTTDSDFSKKVPNETSFLFFSYLKEVGQKWGQRSWFFPKPVFWLLFQNWRNYAWKLASNIGDIKGTPYRGSKFQNENFAILKFGFFSNKVIRPKSRASALSEKSGRQTDEQTKTFKKTFELATKSLKNNFVTN